MAQRAEVFELDGLLWSAGAPEPFVISSEQRTFFGFYLPDVSQDADRVRVGEFTGCTSLRFGFPNDEALGGHPLYGHGLEFYAAHRVIESPWLEELRAIEHSHPMSSAQPFANSQHYLLTFHDSTLEAIAGGIVVHDTFETVNDAASWMAAAAFHAY